ncbi:SRPBCC family protein [Pseudonocardia abyssalis]|uniref:SRPBCC family protein n=2 Tax=Pseudonocardia abyssalis TaxID=2792008 RepID=A0ABS6UUQ1_9PSEU|nr:SRPBCC family protein [Pseudonocardia abyssalis]MBW0135985.1 SRPBCC family protein [Pseudonocardia abyssalis]
MNIDIGEQLDVDRPAAEVWAVVADYAHDPQWRGGVTAMDPTPAGAVRVGQRTDERMRFAGRAYRNAGVVEAVGPGRRFAWRTTAGVDAEGARSVEETGVGTCTVKLELRVRPHGIERLLAPVLRVALRRGLRGDLARLGALVEAGAGAR